MSTKTRTTWSLHWYVLVKNKWPIRSKNADPIYRLNSINQIQMWDPRIWGWAPLEPDFLFFHPSMCSISNHRYRWSTNKVKYSLSEASWYLHIIPRTVLSAPTKKQITTTTEIAAIQLNSRIDVLTLFVVKTTEIATLMKFYTTTSQTWQMKMGFIYACESRLYQRCDS